MGGDISGDPGGLWEFGLGDTVCFFFGGVKRVDRIGSAGAFSGRRGISSSAVTGLRTSSWAGFRGFLLSFFTRVTLD
jgi:hypothetical protein